MASPDSIVASRSARAARRVLRTIRGRLSCALIAAALLPAMLWPAAAPAAERLAICHGSPASALVPLAGLRGFFAAEGLEVEMRTYPSGFQALEAMLAGQCSLSTAAVPPVVHQSLRRRDFRVVAGIATSDGWHKILVRRDRGIHRAADLRGKRIAVAQSTSAHYFLDMFLVAHGLGPADAVKVFLPAQEVGPALLRGDADAMSHWEPNVQPVLMELGERGLLLPASGLEDSPFLLLARLDFIERQPKALQAVLRALLRAEDYARAQPAEARRQLAGYFGLERKLFDYVWALHRYQVALDQPLLFSLENVARWQTGLMPPAQRPVPPNYLEFIHVDGLKTVRRQAVRIIH